MALQPHGAGLPGQSALRSVTGRSGHTVATLETVARSATKLPEVTEGERHSNPTWFVRGQASAWDRPVSKD